MKFEVGDIVFVHRDLDYWKPGFYMIMARKGDDFILSAPPRIALVRSPHIKFYINVVNLNASFRKVTL